LRTFWQTLLTLPSGSLVHCWLLMWTQMVTPQGTCHVRCRRDSAGYGSPVLQCSGWELKGQTKIIES
jgi:hypothetical protein